MTSTVSRMASAIVAPGLEAGCSLTTDRGLQIGDRNHPDDKVIGIALGAQPCSE